MAESEKLRPVSFAMNDESLLIVDGIAAQLLRYHGCIFSRSQIIRALLHGIAERGVKWERVKTLRDLENEVAK